MYHGSRIGNWVGILNRGILLPDAVTKLGVVRTDFGWLGAGIDYHLSISSLYLILLMIYCYGITT